ncbi:P-loop NTPase family protein [Herpetosiphon geysericola]|uniref:AAA+ ATPase domain-containing protein n=1 Tax=Herpetosiphon geysericola TaxID=70996 RepID=A0A0N8GSR1_9CHLR|nr:type IV secretion system DNA-binding domain-containing protein [Herpetosiphon geysericola]KPL90002.1 hypothetical protein SE18_08600 [Herpetosiphon geysericola]
MTAELWIGVIIAAAIFVYGSMYGLVRLQRRIERREALAAGLPLPDEKPKKIKPAAPIQTPVQQNFLNQQVAQPSMHAFPAGIAATAIEPVKPAVPVLSYKLQDIETTKRGHTAMAGSTGAGKTTTLNTLLANDIKRGVHCIVCSTHYTAYHPEDQQIDLRGITHLFEVAYTPETIRLAIVAAARRIDERLELYRAGKDVGQDTVLYLGEWGSISRNLGKEADALIQKILDEGRKTKVWLVVELHSAIVSRFGGDSGLREAFRTRLAHTVDHTTWSAFVGKEIERQPVPVGYWMTSNGLIAYDRPAPELLNAMAQTMLPNIHEYLLPVSNDADESSSAGSPKPADRVAEKTSSVNDDNALLSVLMGVEKPVFSADENSDENALAVEKPIKNRPNFKLIKNKLDRTILMMLWAGISKSTIVESLQWPDGQNLRNRTQQFKYINTVIEQAAALGIAFEGMALTIDND